MSEDLPEINSASAEMSSRPPEGLLGPELRWHQHQDQLQEDFMARLRGDQDHPPIPELTETYQQAEASWQKLDQPGEANRLAASLQALYRQAGVDDYRPLVAIEEDLSQEQT